MPDPGSGVRHDVLSDVLRTVRLTSAMQFCLAPAGEWRTEGAPALVGMARPRAGVIPFHIIVAGDCWLKTADRQMVLATGDIVMFPFATAHQLGVGDSGPIVTPLADLPPWPWRDLPVLTYGANRPDIRILCGFILCDAIGFAPLRRALPEMLHRRSGAGETPDWLAAIIQQIAVEVASPRSGGLSMLERLTEIAFIEVLRQQIIASRQGDAGWLSALADPVLARCLGQIHADPARVWRLDTLAAESGASRSSLDDRFRRVLATSPMRYLRDWRLYLASVAMRSTDRTIADIGREAGYAAEAAFNRAFANHFATPPATWRARAKNEAV